MRTYRVDKAWARDQERIRRHRVRQALCFASWLPLLATGTLFLFDVDRQTSILELLPAFRDIDEARWLAVWGWIALGCAVLGALLTLALWRCPECRKFLGLNDLQERCPHCEARLTAPRGW